MHACGVELAYLVSYTLTKGISVVTATYSPTFMHAAVPVMALVHELFIAPAKLDLDSVLETIGSHDKLNEARQNLWQAVQQEYQLHQLYLVGTHLFLPRPSSQCRCSSTGKGSQSHGVQITQTQAWSGTLSLQSAAGSERVTLHTDLLVMEFLQVC